MGWEKLGDTKILVGERKYASACQILLRMFVPLVMWSCASGNREIDIGGQYGVVWCSWDC